MGLNFVKPNSNMYQFINATWNTVKGECYHDCSYCYMKRWGKLEPVHFDEKELKTDLGAGNFIFVGSSCDMFANDVPVPWILKTLFHCSQYDNQYLFQTKNPSRLYNFIDAGRIPLKSMICVTIETNRHYPDIMGNSPSPQQRVLEIGKMKRPDFITIEPIMDFDLEIFVEMIRFCDPFQVNIGADSMGKHLPEPSMDKVQQLITELEKFTFIHNKSNLKRLLK